MIVTFGRVQFDFRLKAKHKPLTQQEKWRLQRQCQRAKKKLKAIPPVQSKVYGCCYGSCITCTRECSHAKLPHEPVIHAICGDFVGDLSDFFSLTILLFLFWRLFNWLTLTALSANCLLCWLMAVPLNRRVGIAYALPVSI